MINSTFISFILTFFVNPTLSDVLVFVKGNENKSWGDTENPRDNIVVICTGNLNHANDEKNENMVVAVFLGAYIIHFDCSDSYTWQSIFLTSIRLKIKKYTTLFEEKHYNKEYFILIQNDTKKK